MAVSMTSTENMSFDLLTLCLLETITGIPVCSV